MNGPPKDVEPSDLWRALEARPKTSTTIPFPARPGEASPGDLALVILTEAERHQARINAGKLAREFNPGASPSDPAWADIYNTELAVQLVCACCRNPKDLRFPAFGTPAQTRAVLTTDDFTYLATAYSNFRAERGPILSELTNAELEAWLKVLQEGASRVPLARLSGEALSDLVMFLVSKIPTTGTSSAGAPPDDLSSGLQQANVSELLGDADRLTPEG